MHPSQDRDKWAVVVNGLHERGGIYVLIAEEVASRLGICCMELNWLIGWFIG